MSSSKPWPAVAHALEELVDHARLAAARGAAEDHGLGHGLFHAGLEKTVELPDFAVAADARDFFAEDGARGFAQALFEQQSRPTVRLDRDFEARVEQPLDFLADVNRAQALLADQMHGAVDQMLGAQLVFLDGVAQADAKRRVRSRQLDLERAARGAHGQVEGRGLRFAGHAHDQRAVGQAADVRAKGGDVAGQTIQSRLVEFGVGKFARQQVSQIRRRAKVEVGLLGGQRPRAKPR